MTKIAEWSDQNDVAEYTCTVCGLQSRRLSCASAPCICPACDCGVFRDRTKWSYADAHLAAGTSEQKAEFQCRAAAAEQRWFNRSDEQVLADFVSMLPAVAVSASPETET